MKSPFNVYISIVEGQKCHLIITVDLFWKENSKRNGKNSTPFLSFLKQATHHVMALPIIICQANEHYRQSNRGTWLHNLNEKWIGLWYVQKVSVIPIMHCSNGLFDQMWYSCEPYIIVFSWNWSSILLMVINSNKCFAFKVCFFEYNHIKIP
jgi:hypothetical protein